MYFLNKFPTFFFILFSQILVCFFEIIQKAKSLRNRDALVLISSIVGSSIGDVDSETYLTRAETKMIWEYDLRQEKHFQLAEHYRNMDETSLYSFIEPSLYSQNTRLGPVGKEKLELLYFSFSHSFILSLSSFFFVEF